MKADNIRVLIVDDGKRFRLALPRLLRFKGVAAVAIPNGRKALAELDHRTFEVVVLSSKLPGRTDSGCSAACGP
jgi:DNA-binding response OmpR family regulator